MVATWTRPSGVGTCLSFGPDRGRWRRRRRRHDVVGRAARRRTQEIPRIGVIVYVTKVSPDGRLLACGYETGPCGCDVSTGAQRGVLRGDSGTSVVAFHPSSSRLATESVDGVVRVWDMAAAESLLVLGGKLRTAALGEGSVGAFHSTATADGCSPSTRTRSSGPSTIGRPTRWRQSRLPIRVQDRPASGRGRPAPYRGSRPRCSDERGRRSNGGRTRRGPGWALQPVLESGPKRERRRRFLRAGRALRRDSRRRWRPTAGNFSTFSPSRCIVRPASMTAWQPWSVPRPSAGNPIRCT